MVAIGQIVKSVGVKGECKVALLTDVQGRLERLTTVWVGALDATSEERGIMSVRSNRTGVIVKLEGVDSRTDAERMKGTFLFVPDEQALRPSDASYFVDEIVGMHMETEEGKGVGVVRDVVKLPASDMWIVSLKGREIMIPAVRAFIRSVDLDQKKIIIRPVEGLLDLT